MKRFRNHSGTISENPPKLDSGTIPEPFRKIYQNLIPDTLRNTYGYSWQCKANSWTATRLLLTLPIQKSAMLNKFKLLLKLKCEEVHTNVQLKCYCYPPWNTGALRRSRPLLLAPDFSKLFSRADSNDGRLTDGLQTENCFFSRHQDLRTTASSCPSRDLTDCNMGVQASHAQPHTARPPPQQHRRCGQLFEAHSHRQLMRQRFQH